jgi:glucuronosyltransferase
MANTMFASLLLILVQVHLGHGAKILMIPGNHHSNINYMAVAAQVLERAGHSPVILTVDRHQNTLQKKGVKHILHNSTAKVFHEDDKAIYKEFFVKTNIIEMVFNMTSGTSKVCEEMLTNKELMKQVADTKFDLAIVDGLPISRCMYVIPYKFSIPYITVSVLLDPWQVRVPALPSVEPFFGTTRFTNDMNILQRLANFAVFVMTGFMLPPPFSEPDYLIEKYCPDKPQTTLAELYLQSEMWLLNHDVISGDYPRVSAPHFQYIGGLGAEAAKPLPADLEKFVQDSTGVVVVSFGSLVKTLPINIITNFLKAFSQRRERFIMRFDTSTVKPGQLTVPPNVKLMKWIPQNDLLGHNKTVLFITHGGNNGMLETLYHGVPCLVMPVVGDQLYASIKIKAKGYGDSLDLFSFTSDELVAALTELIEQKRYTEAMKRGSAISRELYNAHESLVFWVNHILKYGGQHLKHKGFNMSIFQYLMLDLFIICTIVGSILLTCFVYTVKYCVRCCCTRKGKSKTE